MHKAYKKRRALGFRALILGAPRKAFDSWISLALLTFHCLLCGGVRLWRWCVAWTWWGGRGGGRSGVVVRWCYGGDEVMMVVSWRRWRWRSAGGDGGDDGRL
ncbi:hypothetical protein Tco_0681681 [Tanacetum coccineum]|uniref:Uncharacterized protein n=1 Tax=Tanacetum coccineum TaxID=301880 RepID=A0ABQ4XPX8_9ASTR